MVLPIIVEPGGITISAMPARDGLKASMNTSRPLFSLRLLPRQNSRTCPSLPMNAIMAPAGIWKGPGGSTRMSFPSNTPTT